MNENMRQIEALRGDILALQRMVKTNINTPRSHDKNDAAVTTTPVPDDNPDPTDVSQVTIDDNDDNDEFLMDALNSIAQTNQ